MVSVISAGLLLLVYGEAEFHLVGFILVMTAAMLAGLRWTITQVLLQGSGSGGGGGGHGERAASSAAVLPARLVFLPTKVGFSGVGFQYLQGPVQDLHTHPLCPCRLPPSLLSAPPQAPAPTAAPWRCCTS